MANHSRGDYVSATAAGHRLGVSTPTLRRYTQQARLPDARSGDGRRIFRVSDVDALTTKASAGTAVGYARVSSIVASLAGRLYGQRSAKAKRLRAVVAAETKPGDGT